MKAHGIVVFGPNGGGKTTLARELANNLGFRHMDIEAYHFVESEVPYTVMRPREEVIRLMLADIEAYGPFVLSSVTGDFGDDIPQLYTLGVFVGAPKDLRMERIDRRAYAQHGERIRQGGDMFEGHKQFAEFAATRDLTRIDRWAETLTCPVIEVDGTVDLE